MDRRHGLPPPSTNHTSQPPPKPPIPLASPAQASTLCGELRLVLPGYHPSQVSTSWASYVTQLVYYSCQSFNSDPGWMNLFVQALPLHYRYNTVTFTPAGCTSCRRPTQRYYRSVPTHCVYADTYGVG